MIDLKPYFITVMRPYKEGTVEVFEQAIPCVKAKKATLTITALGVYEAEIDDKKVGDVFLAPGYTYYPKDLHVQSYDVTAMLEKTQAGGCTLRVYLGQGWYCGRFTCDNKIQIYGERPAVSWALEIETKDNQKLMMTSADEGVHAVESPYDLGSEYDGEIYFAKGAVHESAQEVIQPVRYDGKLPEVMEESDIYVKVQEEVPIKAVMQHGNVTIIDFGQNFAGIIEIDPSKMEGTCLRLRHGEILKEDGSLYTANLRKAKAEIVYHKGTETRCQRPRFTYMGFRFVELSGTPYVEGLIRAYVVGSEMERTGFFECSNARVERLYLNQFWGQRSNYVEIPTDCPQRDERQGYTGDGHVFARTGAYNFDTRAFWRKFLKDMRYSQADNSEGYVAPTLPALGPAGIGFMTMLGWGNCACIVPEMLYWQYGDLRFIREQYECMKTWVECEIRHMNGTGLWMGVSLGDWLALGKDVAFMAIHNGPVSNAFVVNDLRIMVWAATLLNRPEDAERYSAQLSESRKAYIAAFVNDDGTMKDDYQGAYVMALQFVLPHGELWDKAFTNLVAKLKTEGMQTGFFATQHLLPLLAENGQFRLAFDLLLQPNCPGWMYQVDRGATTTWERWDALRPDGSVNEDSISNGNMVSFNHYSFGSVGEFYYRYILGIQPAEPGFATATIRPFIDARLGSVTGSYESVNGNIRVHWEVGSTCGKSAANVSAAATLCIQTDVPAQIILPDGTSQYVKSGEYTFNVNLA